MELLRCCPVALVTDGMALAARAQWSTPAAMPEYANTISKFAVRHVGET